MTTPIRPSITPLHDRVVIKPDTPESKTAGGIIIPDSAKEKPMQGTVVAAGAGTPEKKMTVKVKDKVLYSKSVGIPIKIKDDECLIMRESDILAIV